MPALSVITLWKLQQSLLTCESSNHPSEELEGSFLRLVRSMHLRHVSGNNAYPVVPEALVLPVD